MTLLEVSYCLMLYSHQKPEIIDNDEVLISTESYHVFAAISTAANTMARLLWGDISTVTRGADISKDVSRGCNMGFFCGLNLLKTFPSSRSEDGETIFCFVTDHIYRPVRNRFRCFH
jgi:hypothetical protein